MLDVHNAGTHWRVAYISESPPSDQCTEEWRQVFASFSDLPPKTQLAIATLRMAKDGEKINHIGRRVSDTAFWLNDSEKLLEEYEKKYC